MIGSLNVNEAECLNTKVWKQFSKGLEFNRKIDLADTVKVNENFFIGK